MRIFSPANKGPINAQSVEPLDSVFCTYSDSNGGWTFVNTASKTLFLKITSCPRPSAQRLLHRIKYASFSMTISSWSAFPWHSTGNIWDHTQRANAKTIDALQMNRLIKSTVFFNIELFSYAGLSASFFTVQSLHEDHTMWTFFLYLEKVCISTRWLCACLEICMPGIDVEGFVYRNLHITHIVKTKHAPYAQKKHRVYAADSH